MMKKKPKRVKIERQRGWEEEENLNPGTITSTSAEDSKHQVITQRPRKDIFNEEIKAMLYAYGDVRYPLPETVSLVEEIVHTQVSELLKATAGVALKRCATEISLEEFLFLLRKDPGKVSRFVQRMVTLHTHMKAAATSANNFENVPPENVEGELEDIKLLRQKVCVDFLQEIDETGELVDAALKQGMDPVKIARLQRAEIQTRDMDPSEYVEYAKCRQITFVSRKNARAKFRDWFDFTALQINLPLTNYGWDALEYLAQETVAELVELSLLVQSESTTPLIPCETEPDSRHLPLYASSSFKARAEILSSNGGADSSATKSSNNEGSLNRKLALKPSHIREALRRFNTNQTAKFLRKGANVEKRTSARLLCLP